MSANSNLIYWPLFFILMLTGCTPISRHLIISPSDEKYFTANRSYENSEFQEAVDLYTGYLESKPQSRYSIPAKLNLGMSYYYLKNWSMAYTTLYDVTINDQALHDFVIKILADCDHESGGTLAKGLPVQESKTIPEEAIAISITDAYINNTGSLVLTGKTDKKSSVFINGKLVENTANNTFSSSFFWQRGRPVEITAKGIDQGNGSLDYYPDTEPPREPGNIRIRNSSSNSAEIEWDENREPDIKGYKLTYGLKGGNHQDVNEIIRKTNYEIVGLINFIRDANRTVEFSVKAIDQMNNESGESDTVELILP